MYTEPAVGRRSGKRGPKAGLAAVLPSRRTFRRR